MKLLIVDDNPVFVEQMKKYLSIKNFEAEGAEGGRKAMKMLTEKKYDFVLMDLKMPDVNGIEILKWAREEGIKSGFIVVTGYGEVESAVEAMKLGAIDYIQKPFEPEKLLEIIEKSQREKREDFRKIIKRRRVLLITSFPEEHLQKTYGIKAAKTMLVNGNYSIEEIIETCKRFSGKNDVIMVFGVEDFIERYGKKNVARCFKHLSSLVARGTRVVVIYSSTKEILKLEENIGNVILPVLEKMITAYNHPIRREIIHLLDISQALSYSEIMRETEIKQSSKLAFHLKRLISLGTVEKKGNKYELSENGKKILDVLEMLAGMERKKDGIAFFHVKSI